MKTKTEADYLQAKKAYWQRVLKILEISIQADERIPDAGCGPAGIFKMLNGCRVYIVDYA